MSTTYIFNCLLVVGHRIVESLRCERHKRDWCWLHGDVIKEVVRWGEAFDLA